MLFFVLILFFGASHCSIFTDSSSIQLEAESFDLPQLNHICSYKFTSPYTRYNFDSTNSLYLSSRSQDILSPDILYQSGTLTNRDVIPIDWNPSTQQYDKRVSTNLFGSAVSNSDIALFTDFGEIPITNITYHSATASSRTYLSEITIQPNHSYGLVISKPDIQAYILIQVENYVVNGDCDILYAVIYYRVRNGLSHAESPNFNGDDSPTYVENGCSLQNVQVPYNNIERGVETAIVILSSIVGGLGLTLTIILVIFLYCCCKRKRCCCFL